MSSRAKRKRDRYKAKASASSSARRGAGGRAKFESREDFQLISQMLNRGCTPKEIQSVISDCMEGLDSASVRKRIAAVKALMSIDHVGQESTG